MGRYKVIALMGPAGSGKDTIIKSAIELYPEVFHKVVTCTTRSPRENEYQGIDYLFLTEEEFKEKIANKEMLEYTSFNNWYYGTCTSSFSKEKINLIALNPAGIRKLLKNNKIDIVTYYLRVSDKERLLRQINRESTSDAKEIARRFASDQRDFNNIEDIPCIEIANERKEDIYTIVGQIHSIH